MVVVPGYLLDAKDFVPLVKSLRRRGFQAALAPIKWYNWLPTVGGRSLRPILDRIDLAVRAMATQGNPELDGYVIQPPQLGTPVDFLNELRDPTLGLRPNQSLGGACQERVALVGSSASGWMSRIYLGNGPPYDGRVYEGAQLVHSLITLGSPHVCNEGITKDNIAFVNAHFPGACESDVKYLCVAGRATQGRRYLGNLVKDFTYQSYELCSLNGEDWGDGITPVQCAVALEGAEKLILDDVWHSPLDGRQWYGSEEIIDQWADFLIDGDNE